MERSSKDGVSETGTAGGSTPRSSAITLRTEAAIILGDAIVRSILLKNINQRRERDRSRCTPVQSLVEIERRLHLNRTIKLAAPVLLSLLTSNAWAQATSTHRSHRRPDGMTSEAWTFSALVDGYFVPGEQGYADPIFTADHRWLHLEARYNYEDLKTGSLWLGYNFKLGRKTLDITLTPMVGGVFGRTIGIAPGSEASVTYRKLNFWVFNEYVFDTGDPSANYFYTWPQFTYSPVDWLHVGLVAQRTQAIESDTQAGFLFGLSGKKMEFTSYVLDPGSKPTVVLEVGYNF